MFLPLFPCICTPIVFIDLLLAMNLIGLFLSTNEGDLSFYAVTDLVRVYVNVRVVRVDGEGAD